MIDVPELTVKLAAGLPPKVTAVAPLKPAPVMVTLVPPAIGPVVADRPVTAGTITKLTALVPL